MVGDGWVIEGIEAPRSAADPAHWLKQALWLATDPVTWLKQTLRSAADHAIWSKQTPRSAAGPSV
jgi:hypothetical protein